MNRWQYKVGIVALLLTVALGCASGSREPLSSTTGPKAQELREDRVEQEPEVVLEASAVGNRVHIAVKNNRTEPLVVVPHFFGVIVENKLTRFNPAKVVNQFPVFRLEQGETASGYLRFIEFSDLVGQKLVFRSPDYKPLMVIIQAGRD